MPAPSAIKIDPRDNAAVALRDLAPGDTVQLESDSYQLPTPVAAKHKFACEDLPAGGSVRLYGSLVGETTRPVARGESLTTDNLVHRAESFAWQNTTPDWTPPDTTEFQNLTFEGFHRADGSVGTANVWIVLPMVFCENRNVDLMRQALNRALGTHPAAPYEQFAHSLAQATKNGASVSDLRETPFPTSSAARSASGSSGTLIKFLSHGLGCGGTRDDAQTLCGLLAGYVTHPNVAGATVLSLGCQNAEVALLEQEISKRSPHFDKPLLIFEQQKYPSETQLMTEAIRETFIGFTEASKLERQPAPLSKLTVGVECGASDGFSGISANPAIGHAADLVVALGGKAILSEFPELCGAEQPLIDRCASPQVAEKFIKLMEQYADRAEALGSALHMNPSPGNIRDGLITDAIKSAGAAKKGGTSPVVDVLDYPGWATEPGLTLLCTPGNDVESTTALAGAHANLILFSTGLGTPTGNPVTPVIKVSSNTTTATKHDDLIDFDAGPILTHGQPIAQSGADLLNLALQVASGHSQTKATQLAQDDFLPWKRGVSL
ncbi:MAG: altronate dehydratase family protein [Verrucomicrobiota bacterium]